MGSKVRREAEARSDRDELTHPRPLFLEGGVGRESERVAHVVLRRVLRVEGGVGEHLDDLLHGDTPPLGVHVELRKVGGVGGAPVGLGERTELLKPLGDGGGEASLAAARGHAEDVLGAVDLVRAVGTPALLDALIG